MLLVVVMDYTIGHLLKLYYFKQKSGVLYNSTYAIDSTKEDVLVFGSSKAMHHYVPSIFEDSLKMSFYNCGRGGQDLFYSMAVFSAVIKRYQPKYVLIDILPNEFTYSNRDRLASILPYSDNPTIKEFVPYKGNFEKYKLLSKIYPYNSLLVTILKGDFGKNDLNDYKGFVMLSNVSKNHPAKEIAETGSIDMEKVNLLGRIVTQLDQLKINNCIVISPSYLKYKEGGPTPNIADSICKKSHYSKFVNYSDRSGFRDYRLFSDDEHLNGDGAHFFSKSLIKELRL